MTSHNIIYTKIFHEFVQSIDRFKINECRENLVRYYYITMFSLILLLPFYFPFTDLVHPTLSVLSIIIECTL